MALSAFIVNVPEAEPYVGELRKRFDPSASLGVPAHITVLYPFMPPELVTAAVSLQVREVLSRFAPFDFRLKKVGRFPGSVFLEPDPAEPFIALAHALAHAFPDWPPYGGQQHAVVPHLTVARTGKIRMQRINSMLDTALADHGIRGRCKGLELIENSQRSWRPLHTFALDGNPLDWVDPASERAAD